MPSGSQKKIMKSISPSETLPPICWAPPSGPLCSFVTPRFNSCSRMLPVVPVADFIISSPLMLGKYERLVPDYDAYRTRKLPANGP